MRSAFQRYIRRSAVIALSACSIAAAGCHSARQTREPSRGKRTLIIAVNKDDRSVSLFDPVTGHERVVVPVGGVTGHEVAIAPDGVTAWIPIYGNSGVGLPGTDGRLISVIDLARGRRLGEVVLDRPSRPHCAVFGPDGLLYVTTEVTKSVAVIDPRTRSLVAHIPTGEPQSHMLAISADGARGYTANVSSGTVSVLDLRKRTLLKIIPVARSIQRIAVSPDGRYVFTADQDKALLHVINTSSNSVGKRITLPGKAYGIAVTHDGRRLVLGLPWDDKVAILNMSTMAVERIVPVPDEPQAILVRPDDRMVYVSTDPAREIVAINLATGRIDQRLHARAGVDGMAWATTEYAGQPGKGN